MNQYLSHQASNSSPSMPDDSDADIDALADAEADAFTESIAIVGMACRFPHIDTPDAFWQFLKEGRSGVAYFTDEELKNAGIPEEIYQAENFINARGTMEQADHFDPHFFDMSVAEARHTDPQHRVFLELAWEVLEHAGYNPENYPGLIGVYAGNDPNGYAMANFTQRNRGLATIIGNDRDYVATRTAFKLNLRGPAVNLANACSTSLVAVQLAYRALLDYQCDMAMAGGVGIAYPQKTGAMYQQDSILSPDGVCRAFDAKAQGTVGGDGAGVVLLKRFSEAQQDNDTIYALIKGAAINNDGCDKVGFTAPSVSGQAEVITMAQAMGEVHPETISYIETHGTGTKLGDPIEIAALTEAFRAHTTQNQYCAIGSLKTNLGHMSSAAGVGSLIKAVLALHHQQIPASLNFSEPNPLIDFANSPFFVNTQLRDWQTDGTPRRCGVSSFGIGGTNAHVVLEEAPQIDLQDKLKDELKEHIANEDTSPELIMLSARSPQALSDMEKRLCEHLSQEQQTQNAASHASLSELSDIAYTLTTGRKRFEYSCFGVFHSKHALQEGLANNALQQVEHLADQAPSVVFVFPGQGAQYAGMGEALYYQYAPFQAQLDLCAGFVQTHANIDLLTLMFNEPADVLQQTAHTQFAIFSYEYALATLWMSWGVQPEAMIGHSIGEYVAACLAGVVSLEDAIRLVAKRGQLMSEMPAGTMMVLHGNPQATLSDVTRILNDAANTSGDANTSEVDIAAINGAGTVTLSGSKANLTAVQSQFEAQGFSCTLLSTSHGFHSRSMEPAAQALREFAKTITHCPPTIPYLSNFTGAAIDSSIANLHDANCWADYWEQHCRHTVQFQKGLRHLLQEPDRVFLEMGPGASLTSLVNKQLQHDTQTAMSAGCRSRLPSDEVSAQLLALASLDARALTINWHDYYAGCFIDEDQPMPRRVALPTYPFQREQYTEDDAPDLAQPLATTTISARAASTTSKAMPEWFYLPGWKRIALPALAPQNNICLLFSSDKHLLDFLHEHYQRVVLIETGMAYNQINDNHYCIAASHEQHYQQVLGALFIEKSAEKVAEQLESNEQSEAGENTTTDSTDSAQNLPQVDIIHDWSQLTRTTQNNADYHQFRHAWVSGSLSLKYLANALQHHHISANLRILTTGSARVNPAENAGLLGAPLAAFAKVLNQEYASLRCQCIDIETHNVLDTGKSALQRLLFSDASQSSQHEISQYERVACRNGFVFAEHFEPVTALPSQSKTEQRALPCRLTPEGVYLITGGLGTLGLALAHYLVDRVQGRVILVGRTALAPRESWPQLAETDPRIQSLLALESKGAQFMTAAVDVADEPAMTALLADITQRFGRLNGVFHLAGVVDMAHFDVIQSLTEASTDIHLRAKAEAVCLLETLLPEDLDFHMLFSSLSVVLGGLGFAAYAAANGVMDAVAARNPRWLSVNFDAWADEQHEAGHHGGTGIPVQKAGELFELLLDLPEMEQVLVSTSDIAERLQLQKQTTAQSAQKQCNKSRKRYPRPAQKTEYVAPRDELETELCEIWCNLLGYESLGVFDNFFNLGGDSLQAIQLGMELKEKYHVQLAVNNIFDEPHIAGLAIKVREALAASSSFEEKLAMIENLSEEEVQALLLEMEQAETQQEQPAQSDNSEMLS